MNNYIKASEVSFEICVNENMKDNKFLLSLINDYEDKKWRYQKFTTFIIDMLSETALSHDEKKSLCGKLYSILEESIRKTNCQDGEMGEVFLYGIMKEYYNALPIVPKIFYKQSRKVNAYGADSVHVTIEDNKCHLWLGESKFYQDIGDAIRKAIESIKETLTTDKLKAEKKYISELKTLRKYLEDNEKNLTCDIVDDFEKLCNRNSSIDDLKKILHVPISIIYECQTTNTFDILNEDYKEQIKKEHHKHCQKIIKNIQEGLGDVCYLNEIKFHIILFPVPNKNKIVELFQEKVKVFQ